MEKRVNTLRCSAEQPVMDQEKNTGNIKHLMIIALIHNKNLVHLDGFCCVMGEIIITLQKLF